MDGAVRSVSDLILNERGDGLGLAAGLLQSAAAVTGAVVSSEGSGASSSLKLSLAALGGVATAASIGDAAETGGLQGALLTGIGPLLGAISSAMQQASQDPTQQRRVADASQDIRQQQTDLPANFQSAAVQPVYEETLPPLSGSGAALQ